MPTFSQGGVIYEELPNGQVRVVGYEDGPPADPTFDLERPSKQLDIANTQSTIQDRAGDNERADRTVANSEEKQAFDFAAKLRGDFQSSKEVDEYQTVIRQFSSALKTKPNPQGDQALIVSYAKMLDPGSVVREQEFNVVAAGDSRIGQAVSKLKKELGVDGSGLLRPEIRESLRREMLTMVGDYRRSYERARQDFSESAEAYGVDPQRVVGTHIGTPYYDDIKERWGELFPQRDNEAAYAAPPSLADSGDDTKTIPIPQQMQQEHAAWINSRPGGWNAQDYAQHRVELDRKYGFGAADQTKREAYASEGEQLNKQLKAGRQIPMAIPPVSAEMTGRDQLNASLFNNELGAAVLAAPPLAGGMDEVAGGLRAFINGTDYGVEREKANAMRQAAQNQYPVSSIGGALAGGLGAGGLAARYAPRLATAAASTFPRVAASGAAFGAGSGALEMNQDRATGAGYGVGLGAGGAAAGRFAAPALAALTGSRPVNATMDAVTRGRYQAPPRLSRVDKAVGSVPIGDIRANVRDAADLGLPYSLADATPQTRALAGSAARFSPNVRQRAEDVLTARKDEAPERALNAIRNELAEPVDTATRRKELYRAGSTEAGPIYEEVFSRPTPISKEIDSILNSADGQEALNRAYRIAEGEGYNPIEVGFSGGADNAKLIERPTFRALDMVKRGLDSIVETKRNLVTGELDTIGDPSTRALDNMRKRLVNSMDAVEPRYKDARATYEQYAKQATDLDRGYAAQPRNVLPRDMERATTGMKPENLEQYRTGYATRLSDEVTKSEVGDPIKTIYGRPNSTTSNRKAKVDMLFPNNRMGRIGELERDMESTYRELLGGSQTQPRNVADQQFAGGIGDVTTRAAIDAASGVPIATTSGLLGRGMRALADRGNLGGMGAVKKADEIGPTLIDTGNPRGILDYLDELDRRQRAVALRNAQYQMGGGLFGAMIGPASVGLLGE